VLDFRGYTSNGRERKRMTGVKRGKGERGGRTGKADWKGRRRKVGKGKGGDKSPAWSSQNLGSTGSCYSNNITAESK